MTPSYDYKIHTSVLKNEVINYLTENDLLYNDNRNKSEITCHHFADLTFGGGGHSISLLENIYAHNTPHARHARIIAFDQDPDAISNGKTKIKELSLEKQIELIHLNFGHFPEFVQNHINDFSNGFSGILLDLGVSSHQLDTVERGLSFRGDAPLDMRMNYSDDSIPTAAYYLNTLSKDELVKVISEYGEDRFANRIASAIVEKRRIKAIETTAELENIIFHSYPPKLRYGLGHGRKKSKHIHPATRTFQALRLLVNRELSILKDTLPKLFDLLAINGRLICISFHSLEDRIVKETFKEIKAKNEEKCSILTKKPIVPSEEEIKNNLRSRSAKLRVIEKL
ncbi:MAG: 16S rRNA (cytosine(1402)-N(4))-methyltransferase RsmH [Oligoflexia bacterium]|nr:16S rRNA (cytosine(1402)-N(4))-methyltransferase RsmH [Oligoflexia bacterium]